jgi:protoporphyrinogen IX oxidase
MEYYTWILTFHIMAFMSWMAMLFYQPRLYVYHTEYKDKKDYTDVVEIQEEKMYKYIGNPAMIATILSGLFMIYLNPALLTQDWMIAKLIVALLLIAYSLSLNTYRKQLKDGTCTKSGNFFRAYNEIPTLLALLIVGYVIVKTFSLLFTLITLVLGVFIVYKVFKQKPKGSVSDD